MSFLASKDLQGLVFPIDSLHTDSIKQNLEQKNYNFLVKFERQNHIQFVDKTNHCVHFLEKKTQFEMGLIRMMACNCMKFNWSD